MKKTWILLALLIICGVLVILLRRKEISSIQRQRTIIEQYGIAYNPERKKAGLPIVEESWSVRDYDSSYVRWSYPSKFFYSKTPEHIWKTAYFEDSVLVLEEDAFNYNYGDSLAERLIVSFNIRESDSTKFEFIRHYYKSYPPSESASVSYEFVDSVFNSWGFKAYYRNFGDQKRPLPE